MAKNNKKPTRRTFLKNIGKLALLPTLLSSVGCPMENVDGITIRRNMPYPSYYEENKDYDLEREDLQKLVTLGNKLNNEPMEDSSLNFLNHLTTNASKILDSEKILEIPRIFDLYLPQNYPIQGRYPLVIDSHGGAWVGGSKENTEPRSLYLAQQGFIVASPNYRLAPLNKWPAMLEDVNSLLYGILEGEIPYINPNRIGNIFTTGHSAGGHLALCLAIQEETRDYITASGSLSGPTNLRTLAGHGNDGISDDSINEEDSPLILTLKRIGVYDEFMPLFEKHLTGFTYQENSELFDRASPYFQVTDYNPPSTSFPPSIVIQGELDPLINPLQGIKLVEALTQRGNTAQLIMRGGWHKQRKTYAEQYRLEDIVDFFGTA